MKIRITLLFLVFIWSCGQMDPKLKNPNFELKGPYIGERGIYYINQALNTIVKIDSESYKVNKFKLKNKIHTFIDKLLPEIYFTSINEENGLIYLIHFDESKMEEEIIDLGSPFTSFETSMDKKYLIMRHSSESPSIGSGKNVIFFKNEIGIFDTTSKKLTKTTLNFSITAQRIIFSEPIAHLLSIICEEGVIIMDYENPTNVKYVYLDINKKSPEIDYGLFSKTGKYLFFKAKNKDDIYSLSITNSNEELSINVNVPSSPYKGLEYIAPVEIDEKEDTFVAKFNYPSPKLIIMSAESNTTYQNQISLDSGSYLLDTFSFGKNIYSIIVNYWLKYIKVVSIFPIAENQKEEIKVFADDFKVIGYSDTKDILLMLFDNNGTSIKYIRPMISDKSIKMINKEFAFISTNNLISYSPKNNIFFFISASAVYDKKEYQFNYINLNNNLMDSIKIDYLPARMVDINDQSFLLMDNGENDYITLINVAKEPGAVSFIGLKYNELLDF